MGEAHSNVLQSNTFPNVSYIHTFLKAIVQTRQPFTEFLFKQVLVINLIMTTLFLNWSFSAVLLATPSSQGSGLDMFFIS